MNKIHEISLPPELAFNETLFKSAIFERLQIRNDGTLFLRPIRRSIDARSKNIVVKFQVEIISAEEARKNHKHSRNYPDVTNARPVIIIGAGPAGLFAALRLMESGIKPIILERGKDVQSRRRDLAAINKDHIVDPDSNYCFGEGGAGTYSDGKLYTRSKKRGDVKRILEILEEHGAPEEILFDAHPHIGTNMLPKVVTELRESIKNGGGEIHFNTKVTDLIVRNNRISEVHTRSGIKVAAEAVILATGHSARDIFQLLLQRNVLIDAKPFAVGIRVEHAQSLIDTIQYHCAGYRGEYLPASSYALVHQASVKGVTRGVFSFCMCPGGFIVPAATQPGEIVVNGMSPSRRDSKFANSGIVVEVAEKDYQKYAHYGPLAGMYFQSEIEQNACKAAGGTQRAPAQRMIDFVDKKMSSTLLETSYQPGLTSTNMEEILPEFISDSLRQGFKAFGKKMKGYMTNEAQLIGIESRTSSPVRIPRNKETLEHPQIKGLFPCGEGAGYAGGIVSAAMDGERCAEAAAKLYFNAAC